MGKDFIAERRDALIAEFGGSQYKKELQSYYNQEKNNLLGKEHDVASQYHHQSNQLADNARPLNLGVDVKKAQTLQEQVGGTVLRRQVQTEEGYQQINHLQQDIAYETQRVMKQGQDEAQQNTLNPKVWIKHNQLHPKE